MLSDLVLRLRMIRARERLGLSPREMAKRLKTSRRIYEQWESGQRRIPGPALVAAELAAGIISKEFPQPGSLAARVLELADGSMTTSEAAQALGTTPGTVRNAKKPLTSTGAWRMNS